MTTGAITDDHGRPTIVEVSQYEAYEDDEDGRRTVEGPRVNVTGERIEDVTAAKGHILASALMAAAEAIEAITGEPLPCCCTIDPCSAHRGPDGRRVLLGLPTGGEVTR